MNTLSPLPFVPTAQPNESPLSLLRRTATGNGYTNFLALLHSLLPHIDHSAGMPGYVARSPLVFKSLCQMLGIPKNSMKQVAYQRAGNGREDNVIWQGLEVSMSDLPFHTEKICIPCYLEKKYALADWDHFAAIGCHQHQVFLDTHCPVCDTPWNHKQAPLSCSCDIESVLSRLRPIQKAKATFLTNIIKNKNQDKLLILSNLRRVFEWWAELGVFLSQAEQSDYLYHLMQGKWPTSERDKYIDVNPRIILLPLLSATDNGTQLLLNKLLENKAGKFRTVKIEPLFISRKYAQLLLGISRTRFDKFIKEHLVRSDELGRFSLQQINELLLTSNWLPFSHEKEILWNKNRTAAPHPSLAALVKKESVYVLSTSPSPSDSASTKFNDSPLTIKEASRILQANTESVRNLIKIGLLKATKGTQQSAVQWTIKQNVLSAFDQEYVFASAIARIINLPVTTTASRLRSLDIRPVSGPGIDKGKTYLFSRPALDSISDETLIHSPYKSPAGRKRRQDSLPSGTTITSRELATRLHMDCYQIRFVVRDGWIKGNKNSQGHYQFKSNDVDRLIQKIHDDYLDIDCASELTDQTLQSFRRTWVISGFVTEHKLGSRRLITQSGFQKIMHIWNENKTSAHIAKQMGRQRSICSNLEKIELLKPTMLIGEKYRKIKFYAQTHRVYQYYIKYQE